MTHFFRFIDDSTSTFNKAKTVVISIIQEIKKYSDEIYSIALGYPPFAYSVSVANNWYNLARDMTLHFLQNHHVQRLVDSILSKANIYSGTTFKLIDLLVKRRDIFTYTFEYQPERGYINYVQTLPIQWYEFGEIPQFFEIFSLNDNTPVDITEFYFNANDAIQSFSTLLATKTFLPPFSATAMLIGDKHFVTFDGKMYDFGGQCSYLLASDFANNRFSIVANYRGRKRVSLDVLVDNLNIEMFRDGRVFVNQTRIELPTMINNSYIKQEGSRIILFNKQGFLINCNLVQNICLFKLSGWYFGRTGGLFGVYDNEPSNDWMTPERVLVPDLIEFVQSWQVGDSCIEDYAQVSESLNSWDREKCASIFLDEDSTLRPCFGIVDPKPYYNVCLREMEMLKSNAMRQSGFCLASAAYIEQCRMNKIDLGILLDCVMCQVPLNPLFPGGHHIRYTDIVERSADVIFVIEQSQCAADIKFKSIVSLVESSLVEDGILDNQYALVGYGGQNELIDPHMFTASSKIFNDANSILSAFER